MLQIEAQDRSTATPENDATSLQRSLRRHFFIVTALSLSLVVGIGGWATTTELSSAVIAPGRVVIEGNSKDIQHLAGGIVSEILVKEGNEVAAGDILLRLDPTLAKANLSIVESSLARMYVRRARLIAEIKGENRLTVSETLLAFLEPAARDLVIASEAGILESGLTAREGSRRQLETRKQQLSDEAKGLASQITAVQEQAELINEEAEQSAALYEKRLITLQRYNLLKRQKADLSGQLGQLTAQKAQVEGKASEIDLQILQLERDHSTQVAQDLTTTETSIVEYEERRAAALDQLKRLEITSPVQGRVHQIAINNVGAVVQPGAVLMRVVPDRQAFEVEVRLTPKDIDQIHLDQSAEIRFTAFNLSVTPDMPGKVVFVGPDLQIDPRTNEAYYTVKLRIDETHIASLNGKGLYPGMPAEVFIKIGDRNVASYFTKPLSDRFSKAFREE
ncbi:HlyD family type I secretion periplasmic adaptor subunit [Agrobacterium larrymoorei]|uniref:HlyD family type I secretion periplasmic adaptor subunit n=1 Tax=Agrobacterium larrymoorei TaxID=160699 RepID=UPI0030C4F750